MESYKITYHMFPEADIVITIKANSEDEAIEYAKKQREDAFSIEKVVGKES